MAIQFKTLAWKNFLSTGNTPVTISLNSSSKTLIVGENGSGKSTMIDALCFCLFGKAYRNINKNQMINSINERECSVECEFSIGPLDYKIIRGIKPNVFEIYENGILLNQNAAARDYQKHLEKNILRLNYKSFIQIVILGSANYKPFMELTAGERREVIEDLLDIQIFTTMNQITKERVSEVKQAAGKIETDINMLRTQIRLKNDNLASLQRVARERDESRKELLEKDAENLAALIEQSTVLESHINSLIQQVPEKPTDIQPKCNEYAGHIASLKSMMGQTNKTIQFFEANPTCPTCQQAIDEIFRGSILESRKKESLDQKDILDKLTEKYNEIQKKYAEVSEKWNKIAQEQSKLTHLRSTISDMTKRVKEQKAAMSQPPRDSTTEDIQKLQDEIATMTTTLGGMEGSLLQRQSEAKTLATILQVLKDDGIKARIIKQYIPVMNTLLNAYLNRMNFFVSFVLDENFKETILSRHRDEFTYNSFSEGQKFRINISLLFTWREIARRKNSIDTNLLILDEIFDSSLDGAGVSEFMDILDALCDPEGDSGGRMNAFVISHRGDAMMDQFDSVMRYTMDNGFTRMELI